MTPRHAIIVGAGPGLGAALARRCLAGGATVGMIARSDAKLTALAEDLGAGDQVAWHAADAGDADGLRMAIAALSTALGPPDLMIYNAAQLVPDSPRDLTPETLEAAMRVNLIGALVAAQAVAPAMVAAGRGAILFTGGGLALEPYPEWTALAAGKAALRSLSFNLYKDLAPKGVHVAVVAVCGIVEPGGPFDPDRIAEAYWSLAVTRGGVETRELIFQPEDTDPRYNDPDGRHRATSPMPAHVSKGG